MHRKQWELALLPYDMLADTVQLSMAVVTTKFILMLQVMLCTQRSATD